jgi:hypothetical protein
MGELAVVNMEIGPADTTGMDLEENLGRAGNRYGNLPELERTTGGI